MTDRDDLLQQIAADVRALVEPRRHVEPYRHIDPRTRRVRWLAHTTDQPSLLDQLRAGGVPQIDEAGGMRGAFESRPPNAFECFGRLRAIEAGSAWWVSVAWRMTLRDTVEANLRAMVGRAADPTLREVDFKEATADVHRWYGWASVLAGWATPPYTPRASCPHCERLGELRVRLDKKQAICLYCGASWDSATIAILADHIRSEGERADTPNESGVAS